MLFDKQFVKRRLHSEAAAAANRDGRWRNQTHKAAHNGCCRRAAQTRALYTVLKKLLTQSLSDLVETIEAPLVQLLFLRNSLSHYNKSVILGCMRFNLFKL